MRRVLMVETDTELVSAVGRALALQAMEVLAVDAFERASELVRQQEFSLLLIDSDLVAFEDLRVFEPTPVVVTTSFLERGPAERFARAARLLPKPFTSSELGQVLQELGLAQDEHSLLDVLGRAHLSGASIELRVGEGELCVTEGEIVHAAVADLLGEDALVRILAQGGEVRRSATHTALRSIARAFRPLLFDALSKLEELERQRGLRSRHHSGVALRSLRGGAK